MRRAAESSQTPQNRISQLTANTPHDVLPHAQSSLFLVTPIQINQLIEAILHGDEKKVCDRINEAPKLLLEKGTAIDLQGRSFTGTPLQAAIAVDDIAPNANSTGTVEIILEQLKKLVEPDRYHAIFEEQVRELYAKSLRVYISMQEKEIEYLYKRDVELLDELRDNDSEQTEVNEKIRQTQINLAAYADALRSDDLNKLFETHKKAQVDNAFDFKPYVNAIIAIDFRYHHQKAQLDEVMALLIKAKKETEAKAKTKAVIARTGVAPRESDDCRNKPFYSLTLVQKLNRFREKLAVHMQREIIFNPQHILAGLRSNEIVWRILPDKQDPNCHKRCIISSQLCGFAQRLAPEPVKQDIRQGAWYLTEENERRTRQSRFNKVDSNYNELDDVSISFLAVNGVGYKFAAGGWCCAGSLRPFQNLCRIKTAGFQNIIQRMQKQSRTSEQCCLEQCCLVQ